MSLRFETVAVDAHDPEALGRWWAELLGWSYEIDADGDVVVEPPDPSAGSPMGFFKVPDAKSVKNRLHLDLRPDDQDAEVARAEAMGARRVEIGQSRDPATTWVVLADPEGNEFCILRSRT